jgi:general secretion pathway protein G
MDISLSPSKELQRHDPDPNIFVKGLKPKKVETDFEDFSEALKGVKQDCGRYPYTAEGLKALMQPSKALAPKWKYGYMENVPFLDPWDNAYRYESDGNTFTITCLGSDGKPGGTGDAADTSVKG